MNIKPKVRTRSDKGFPLKNHTLRDKPKVPWITATGLSSTKLPFQSLQSMNSAGSPLTAELNRWVYQSFPSRVGLFSGSGGTDLMEGSM